MTNKQDNLKAFRGHLKREIRKTQNEARNKIEQEQLKKGQASIRIDTWIERDKENNWMFIRLSFKKPLIPNDFIPTLEMSLGEIFGEYL